MERSSAVASDPELVSLVIALEDKRFRQHIGVDPISLGRATFRFLVGRPNGGASTIDMQLVRTLTGRRERTLSRKLSEIALAVYIRRRFGADVIVNHYLAVAHTGTFLRGTQVAALWLFGRAAEACTWEEKASLAALLLVPAPERPTASWSLRLERRAAFARGRAGNRPQVRQTVIGSAHTGETEGFGYVALSSLVQSRERNPCKVVKP